MHRASSKSGLAKRKPPPFKPPRPSKSGHPVASDKSNRRRSSTAVGAGASRVSQKKPKDKVAAPSRRTSKPANAVASEDENSDAGRPADLDLEVDDATDGEPEDVTASRHARTAGGADGATLTEDPSSSSIPRKLLARLLYEGFEDKSIKVGKEAMTVVSKYMETFVKEALARAAYERTGADAGDGGDGFLEVEDLEKLAPQLLLDF